MAKNLPSALYNSIHFYSKIEVEANTRYLLKERECLWILQEGEADVFAWEETNEHFIPLFLQSVSPGEIVFGNHLSFEQKALEEEKNHSPVFFLISAKKITLIQIPLERMSQLLQADQECVEWYVQSLERWVGHLLLLFSFEEEKKEIKEVYLSERVELPQGERIRFKYPPEPDRNKRLSWIDCLEGEVRLSGESLLSKQELLPLNTAFWIEAVQPTLLFLRSTEQIIKEERLYKTLEWLHQTLFSYLEFRKEADLIHSLKRSEQRKKIAKKEFLSSMKQLSQVLESKAPTDIHIEEPPLLQALKQIGEYLKLPIEGEVSVAHLTTEQQIKEICAHSRLFYRVIALKDKWWLDPSMPLLAFYGPERLPVALINHSDRYYEFTHPLLGTQIRLKASNAHEFAEEGFSFFPPITEKEPSLFQLSSFSFQHCRKEIVLLLLVAISLGLLNLYLPFAMKQLFDLLTVSANFTVLGQLTLGLILVAISTWVFETTRNFTEQRVNSLSMIKLQMGVWGRLLSLPVAFFRKFSPGEIINQFFSLTHIHDLIARNMILGLFTTCYFFFYFIQMLVFNFSLALMMLIPFVFIAGLYVYCITKQIRFVQKITELSGKIQDFVIQMISGLTKLRVASGENRFFRIWARQFYHKKRAELGMQRYQAALSLVTGLFPMLTTVFIYAIGIKIFHKEQDTGTATTTIGSFVGFTTAFGLFTSNLLSLLQQAATVMQIKPLWKNSKKLFESPLEEIQNKESLYELKGKVVLDHIFFRYSDEDEWVLNDLSLFANPGEMIAIVGASGSGKSTLVRLLLGFEKPQQGAIYFDDKNLEDLDLRSLRTLIGTVLQNGALMGGSIYDNIVMSGNYSDEELKRALSLSGFAQDLASLPMGIHTLVPMGGETFSGGQRQRLLLARALIGSPKILLLDEATSALDNLTQDFVSQNLDGLNVTRIVIAHRISTIKNADRIYVLEKGVITQVGSYQELANKPGFFATLLARQQL